MSRRSLSRPRWANRSIDGMRDDMRYVEAFFGLVSCPFDLTPEQRYLL